LGGGTMPSLTTQSLQSIHIQNSIDMFP
jgi:hypothetical protein